MPGAPQHGRYLPEGRFVARIASRPFEVIAAWTAASTSVLRARQHLRSLIADPVVREAVFVASPSLSTALATEPALASEAPSAPERAVARYVGRMCSRATPFGLFAAVTTGAIAEGTRLALADDARIERRTRLDSSYVYALAEHLSRVPALSNALALYPSSSLYLAGDSRRYVHVRFVNGERVHRLVATETTPELELVVERARAGATRDELARVLVDAREVEPGEAASYVDGLVAAQLLVSSLEPPVTGADPVRTLIRRLEAVEHGRAPAATLGRVVDGLAELDRSGLGLSARAYAAVTACLRELPVPPGDGHHLQVDLFRTRDGLRLGRAVVAEIERGVAILRQIGASGPAHVIRELKRRFEARYEAREVPLAEALDDESGIGFLPERAYRAGAVLLADLSLPEAVAQPELVAWGLRERHLLSLVVAAERAGAREISLGEADVAALASTTQPGVPPTVVIAQAMLSARSADRIDHGEFEVLLSLDSNATGLFGRFCHGSPEIAELTAAIVERERARQAPAVVAEVVHLPEGRLGNILLRPVLRSHEIPYLGRSGAPPDHQLGIDDLMLSIVDDRLRLRSRRLMREVVPRNTTAHNVDKSTLNVYRFLSMFGAQDGEYGPWSWGPLISAPFLPRIRHGRIVLSRARWRLSADEVRRLAAAPRTEGARARAVAELAASRRLPRWFCVADADNELLVDLENPLIVDSFVHLVRARDEVKLVELWPEPTNMPFEGAGGHYVHELQIPFVFTPDPGPGAARAAGDRALPVEPVAGSRRRFTPGSEWLYVKIYAGPASVQRVLRAAIAPLVRELEAGALIQNWFFVRYADPEWHVRLRLEGRPHQLAGVVLPRVHAAVARLLDNGTCWKIVLDTYEREVERYGGLEAMALVEQIFTADSAAAVAIAEAHEGNRGHEAGWRVTTRGIDGLLGQFGYDLDRKLIIMTRLRDGVEAELGLAAAGVRGIGDKFRRVRADLDALLGYTRGVTPDPRYEVALAALAARDLAIAPPIARLHALAAAGTLVAGMDNLVGSLVHMHVNRMLVSAHRLQELVIYDFMRRLYEGARARRVSSS